jgi:hypothetical protein
VESGKLGIPEQGAVVSVRLQEANKRIKIQWPYFPIEAPVLERVPGVGSTARPIGRNQRG